MEIKITNMPEKKAQPEVNTKIKGIVEDRNKAIAKRFGVEPFNVEVVLYFSKGALCTAINPNGEHMGIFAGYIKGQDKIHLAHPEIMAPIFRDNLNKQILILVDYALIKMYLNKIYYPNPQDFKTYYRSIAESLADITSGKFQEEIIKYTIKTFSSEKRYKKDQELSMVFYIMLKKSGLDYIYEHLKKIIEDCDIRKTIFHIYKKSFNDLIEQYQKEILEQEKKLRLVR